MALNVNLNNAGSHNEGFGAFSFIVNDGPGFSNRGYSNMSFQFTTANAIAGSLVSNLFMANGHGAMVLAQVVWRATGPARDTLRTPAGKTHRARRIPEISGTFLCPPATVH